MPGFAKGGDGKRACVAKLDKTNETKASKCELSAEL